MSLLKTIISAFLILCYALAFAHSLIPHCEESSCGESLVVHHHHKHHEHSHHHDETDDHSHIKHADHIDEGIWDLIVCVLSELEHHGLQDSQISPNSAPGTTKVKKLDQLKFIAFVVGLFQDVEAPSNQANYLLSTPLVGDQYFLGSAPLRGPPTYFS